MTWFALRRQLLAGGGERAPRGPVAVPQEVAADRPLHRPVGAGGTACPGPEGAGLGPAPGRWFPGRGQPPGLGGHPDHRRCGSCIFAARHDMRSWPLFGRSPRRGRRSSSTASTSGRACGASSRWRRRLRWEQTVIRVSGRHLVRNGLLPFRTVLFEASVVSGAPVVPASIRYLAVDGVPLDAQTSVWWGGSRGAVSQPCVWPATARSRPR